MDVAMDTNTERNAALAQLVQVAKVSGRSRGGVSSFTVLRSTRSADWYIAYPCMDRVVIYDQTFAQTRTIHVSSGATYVAVALCSQTENLAVADSTGQITVWDPANCWETCVAQIVEPAVTAVGWLDGGSLVAVGSFLSVYTGLPLTQVFRTRFPNKLLQLEAVATMGCFATLSEDATFVKIWYFLDDKVDFFYLPHPQRVLSISLKQHFGRIQQTGYDPEFNSDRAYCWSGPQRADAKRCLLTNCEDGIARIWSISFQGNSPPVYVLVATIDGYVHWMSCDLINDTIAEKTGTGNLAFDSAEANSTTQYNNVAVNYNTSGLDTFKTNRIRNMLRNYSDMVFTISEEGDLSVWGVKYLESYPIRETRTIILMKFENAISKQDLTMFDGKVTWLPNNGLELILIAGGKNGRMACWNMNLYDFFAARWTTPKLRLLHQWCAPSNTPKLLERHPNLPYALLLDTDGGLTLWQTVNGRLILLRSLPQDTVLLAVTWINFQIPVLAALVTEYVTDDVAFGHKVEHIPRELVSIRFYQYSPETQITTMIFRKDLNLSSKCIGRDFHFRCIAAASRCSYELILVTTYDKGSRYRLSFDIGLKATDVTDSPEIEVLPSSFSQDPLSFESRIVYVGSLWDISSIYPSGVLRKDSYEMFAISDESDLSIYDLRSDDTSNMLIVPLCKLFAGNKALVKQFSDAIANGNLRFHSSTDYEQVIYSIKNAEAEKFGLKFKVPDLGNNAELCTYSLFVYSISRQTSFVAAVFTSDHPIAHVHCLQADDGFLISVLFKTKLYIVRLLGNGSSSELVAEQAQPLGQYFEFISLMLDGDIPYAVAGLSSGELRTYSVCLTKGSGGSVCTFDAYRGKSQRGESRIGVEFSTEILVTYLMYDKFPSVMRYFSFMHNFTVILRTLGVSFDIIPPTSVPFLDYSNLGDDGLKNMKDEEFADMYDQLFSSGAYRKKSEFKLIPFDTFDKDAAEQLISVIRPGNDDDSDNAVVDSRREKLADFIQMFVVLLRERGGAFDTNAVRFLSLLGSGTAAGDPKTTSCSPDVYAWATFSETHSAIMEYLKRNVFEQDKGLLWNDLASVGFAWWFTPIDMLKQLIEGVARSEYMLDKDPCRCSLYYLALRKKSVLYGLWKITSGHPERDSTLSFIANDFQLPRWANAAAKNAFVLLGRQRYAYAAAFFILGDRIKDAISVCLKQLKDPQLAIVLCRLHCGDESTELKELLETILQDAIMDDDPSAAYLQCILFYRLRKYREALSALCSESALKIISERPYTILLFNSVLERLRLLKNPTASEPFILPLHATLYSETISALMHMGCPLLAAQLLHARTSLDELLNENGGTKDVDTGTVNNSNLQQASAFDWSQPVAQSPNTTSLLSGTSNVHAIDDEYEAFKKAMGLGSKPMPEDEEGGYDDVEDTPSLPEQVVAEDSRAGPRTMVGKAENMFISLQIARHCVRDARGMVSGLSRYFRFLRMGCVMRDIAGGGPGIGTVFATLFTRIDGALARISQELGLSPPVASAQLIMELVRY